MEPESAIRLASCYLPPRELLWAVNQKKHCYIEINEPWQKQTLRNRTYILGPNGVQTLTVPVCHVGRAKAPMKDIRISYAEAWIRVHKGALFSAYNSSAFFEYFREELFGIYDSRPVFLVDLNEALHQFLRKRLKLSYEPGELSNPEETEDGRPLAELEVLRATLPPGPAYSQVFGYKFPFTPYLSAIDVLSVQGHL